MKIRTFLFFWAFFSFIFGCKNESQPVVKRPNLFINFDVEKEKTFPIRTEYWSEFIFSPLDSNQVWFLNSNFQRLNLSGGIVQNGLPFLNRKRLLKNEFYHDRVHDNLWFAGTGQANSVLYKIDTKEKKVLDFKGKVFLNAGEINYIGLNGGFIYTVNNEGAVKDKFLVKGAGGINSLCEISADSIFVNSEFIYLPKQASSFPTSVGECKSDANHPANNFVYSGIDRHLNVKGGGDFIELGDGAMNWLYNQKSLFAFFGKKQLTIYNDFETLYDFKFDEKYLYLLTNEDFRIINKKHALANYFKNADEFLIDKRAILNKFYADRKRAGHFLEEENINLDSFFILTEKLKLDYQDSESQNIQEYFKYSTNNLGHRIYLDEVENEVKKRLKKNRIPKQYLRGIFQHLTKKEALRGDLNKALEYSKKVEDIEYESDNWWEKSFESSVLNLEKTIHQIDSLKQLNLPVDIFLFEKIKLTEQFVYKTSWFSSESMYNTSIVHNLVRQFLKEFPRSSVVDKVGYKNMKLSLSPRGCVPDFEPKNIPMHKKFIATYPYSDLVPKAMLELANQYELIYPKENDAALDTLKKGLALLDKIEKEYPVFADSSYIEGTRFNLEKSMLEAKWTMSIATDKTYYSPGEPVFVTVSIKNNLSKSQKLYVFKNTDYPKFPIFSRNFKSFQKDLLTDSVFAELIISGDSTISETYDITEKVFSSNNSGFGYGKMILEEPTKHRISASYYEGKFRQRRKVSSNEIDFYIKPK